MAKIFISYRREDSAGHAGRLCDRLEQRFGAQHVFVDVDDLKLGDNFAQAIEQTIAASACVLVVIGPRWLDMLRERSTDAVDFVRHEIATALRLGRNIVPVLVAGAKMPGPGQLPRELAELSLRHALQVRDDRFDDDITMLVNELQKTPSLAKARPARRRRLGIAAAAAALVMTAFAAYWLQGRGAPDISGVWLAEMRKPGQEPYRIRLTIDRAGDSLLGRVEYPTGEGAIQEGVVKGTTLTFFTSHVPQFADMPAIIRFHGEIENEGIELTSSDDNGVATGRATRASAAPE